jgi:hypothetical protein
MVLANSICLDLKGTSDICASQGWALPILPTDLQRALDPGALELGGTL